MNYRNAKHISGGRINCEIEHHLHGWIPYTLDPDDTDMTVNNDDLLASMAEADDVAAYVPPTQDELDVAKAVEVRQVRDAELATVVDPLVSNPLRWADLTTDQQTAWGQYRTDLLNVPQQSGFPNTVIWPVKP